MLALTAELIADMALPRELDLSPDGTRLAYALTPLGKRDEHATAALWVAPVDGAHPPRPFTAGTANDRRPRWSPDGTRLAFLSDRATRGTDALYVIASDGGEARAVIPGTDTRKRAVEDFAWSPGGGHIAFTSAEEPDAEDERRERERDDADVYGERWPYARLRLVSLASDEVTTLATGDRHVAQFAWAPDGSALAYVTQQIPGIGGMERELTLWRVPVAGGEPQEVCRYPAWIDALVWPGEGDTLLFMATVAGTSQSSHAIFAVPSRGGEPARIACGEDTCAGALVQSRGSNVAAVLVGAGLDTRVCLLDPASGALAQVYPATKADRASDLGDIAVAAGADGLIVAATRSAGGTPPEVWTGDARRAGMRQVSAHQTALAGIAWGRQEPFRWTAPDGWEMDGLVVTPPDDADRPLPTVVLVHGGPYGRWGQGFNLGWASWAQWLALDGYAVLLPNPRGGYGHGEAFAAAVRGDVGGSDFGDIMAMVDAAIKRGITDPDRLAIGGWSQGGYMAAVAVTRTRRFKAAIMGAGVSDWGTMAMTSDLPCFESEIAGGAPWDGVERRRPIELSPIYAVRGATTPTLILHGEKDERVPLNQATGLYRALRASDVPVELVVYPREPHGIGERNHQIDIVCRVRSWYGRWLTS